MAETERVAVSPERIDVRPAGEDDRDSLAALQWRWRVEEWNSVPQIDSSRWVETLRAWAASHDRSHFPFVARVDADVVGMAWLTVMERVPTPARLTRLGGHVQSVYVDPAFRNGGVGTALLQRVLEKARLLGLDFLLVHPSELSFAFYRRHGFRDAGQFLVIELTP